MITLSDKDRQDLEKLGGLRWPPEKILRYFGWNAAEFAKEYANEDSEIRSLILKGELRAQFEIESRLQSEAVGGKLDAAKQFSELMKERSFRLSKLDLFGGAEDAGIYAEIQKYIESGCPGTLSDRDQLRLNLLQLIYAFDVRHGDRKTIRLLTRSPYNAGYATARAMLSEAQELFNPARNVSKSAMRLHTADAYDTIYHAILDAARTPQDYALAAGILDKKAKLLQLDQPDTEVLEPQAYQRTFRVNSLDPGVLGLPQANRDILGEQIDKLENVPAAEKKRLRMDARIIDADIVKMLEYAHETQN